MPSKPIVIAVSACILFLGSLAVVGVLFTSVHPLGGLRLAIDADEAGARALAIARAVSSQDHLGQNRAALSKDDGLIRQVYQAAGRERGASLLRDSIPGYTWRVRWKTKSSGSVTFGSGQEENDHGPNKADLPGDITVRLTPSGALVSYEQAIADSAFAPAVGTDSVRAIAEDFVRTYFSRFPSRTFIGAMRTEQVHRVDHDFSWSCVVPPLKEPATLKVKVSGSRVITGAVAYPAPPEPLSRQENIIHGIIGALFIVALIIALVVVAFRRVRSFEIDFRLGIILGVALAVMTGLNLYAEMAEEGGWQLLLVIVVGPLFVGGGFVLLWSVAESIAREAWQEKFTSLDLAVKGHLLHSRVGASIVRGMALGSVSCALLLLLLKTGEALVPDLYMPASDEALSVFASASPPVQAVTHAIYSNLYLIAAFLVFFVSLLRLRFHSPAILIPAGAAAIGIMSGENIVPFGAGTIISIFAAVVLTWTFYRYDILTTLTGFAAMSAIFSSVPLFMVENASYALSGVYLGLFAVCVFAYGCVALFTSDRAIDLEAIVPAFVRHITERERLQRELEIARDVQMSFLPRQCPEMTGVEIACRCVPAQEVGGDYYDFVELGPGRFGVVVGDVSGKGTQAAFYMTLTKGFLKAVTKASQSPAGVMTQLNNLFYENVERGTFISMVYAIFDIEQKAVTLARAGHNPPVWSRKDAGSVDLLQPAGLALGLENGRTFGMTIQEFSAPLCSGDMFVFYTDGFTESMNKLDEEFGEERFRAAVQRRAGGSADAMMNGLLADVKDHAGRSRQHDDMTIVVVKIR